MLFYYTQNKESEEEIKMNKLPVAPIQDERGILCFSLEGRSYTLNVNSKEERERVKNEINANSLTEYDWFKEDSGEKHWVLYNTEIYEIIGILNKYLHYKELCSIVLTIPVNATSCRYMFHNCSKLTQLDLSIFNTSRITYMFGMFSDCTKLTKLDLSNFNTSNVTNMSFMFDNCKALAQLDLSNFNTSKVTKTSYMFYDCSNLTQLNLSSFDTSHVIDMSWMFYNCQHFTALDIANFNTGVVIDMSGMFSKCSNLTLLNIENFDTFKVINVRYMFCNCKSLMTIYISDKWKTNKVTEDVDMFKECCSLPNFNPEKIDIEMAKPIEQGGYLILKK